MYNVILGRQQYIQDTNLPKHSAFEAEMDIETLKRCKSPGIIHIRAKCICAGGRRVCSEMHKLINSFWNNEKLP